MPKAKAKGTKRSRKAAAATAGDSTKRAAKRVKVDEAKNTVVQPDAKAPAKEQFTTWTEVEQLVTRKHPNDLYEGRVLIWVLSKIDHPERIPGDAEAFLKTLGGDNLIQRFLDERLIQSDDDDGENDEQHAKEPVVAHFEAYAKQLAAATAAARFAKCSECGNETDAGPGRVYSPGTAICDNCTREAAEQRGRDFGLVDDPECRQCGKTGWAEKGVQYAPSVAVCFQCAPTSPRHTWPDDEPEAAPPAPPPTPIVRQYVLNPKCTLCGKVGWADKDMEYVANDAICPACYPMRPRPTCTMHRRRSSASSSTTHVSLIPAGDAAKKTQEVMRSIQTWNNGSTEGCVIVSLVTDSDGDVVYEIPISKVTDTELKVLHAAAKNTDGEKHTEFMEWWELMTIDPEDVEPADDFRVLTGTVPSDRVSVWFDFVAKRDDAAGSAVVYNGPVVFIRIPNVRS